MRKSPRRYHSEFFKIIKCRLCLKLLNRQDSGQICKRNISCSRWTFKKSSEKINIRLLYWLIICLIANQNIPLIYYHYESFSCLCIYLWKHIWKRNSPFNLHIRKCQFKLSDCILYNIWYNIFRAFCRFYTPLYIQMQHIIFIKIFLKATLLTYIISHKQFSRITAHAIICSHHICCNRFTESARSAVTYKFWCGIYHTVCVIQQTCFINIYLRVNDILEWTVIRI